MEVVTVSRGLKPVTTYVEEVEDQFLLRMTAAEAVALKAVLGRCITGAGVRHHTASLWAKLDQIPDMGPLNEGYVEQPYPRIEFNRGSDTLPEFVEAVMKAANRRTRDAS